MSKSPFPDDQAKRLFQSKRGVAILATCIVQTIGETDHTFLQRFQNRLRQAYLHLRDDSPDTASEEMELLQWTMEYLSGFDAVNGQGKPFLSDYKPG